MMFVKKGLAATSVEDIAEAAGYTRGAFYSNFDGKPELLLELLRRDHDSAQAKLRASVGTGGTCEQMKAHAIEYFRRQFSEHDGFPLWVEARLLGCRDAEFQERFNVFRHEKLDQVSAYIRTFSECEGRQPPLQVDALARGLVSLCDGMQLLRMCDPQMVNDEVTQTVLAGFLSRVLQR
ncbi:TetR family transcriptional regulator [Paraburkholderia hospita]|nr:TetR family transcriptional regulator [Paraburkholderia hospita]